MKYTPKFPLVLSSSALGAFQRCPKQFELAYIRGFQTETNEAVRQGSSFHKMMQAAALGVPEERLIAENMGDPMLAVVLAYLKHRGIRGNNLAVEQPLYTKILPSVWVRTTMDRIYNEAGAVTILDYKTFASAPNLDTELNFQCKLYAAIAMRHWGLPVPPRFEFEYVRRTPPFVEKDKQGRVWSPDECYKTWPIYVSTKEAAILMDEATELCRRILQLCKGYKPGDSRFYRVPLTTSGYSAFSCGGCFVRELCKAEASTGRLSPGIIEANTTEIRPFPAPLPKGAHGKPSYLATLEEAEELR